MVLDTNGYCWTNYLKEILDWWSHWACIEQLINKLTDESTVNLATSQIAIFCTIASHTSSLNFFPITSSIGLLIFRESSITFWLSALFVSKWNFTFVPSVILIYFFPANKVSFLISASLMFASISIVSRNTEYEIWTQKFYNIFIILSLLVFGSLKGELFSWWKLIQNVVKKCKNILALITWS